MRCTTSESIMSNQGLRPVQFYSTGFSLQAVTLKWPEIFASQIERISHLSESFHFLDEFRFFLVITCIVRAFQCLYYVAIIPRILSLSRLFYMKAYSMPSYRFSSTSIWASYPFIQRISSLLKLAENCHSFSGKLISATPRLVPSS